MDKSRSTPSLRSTYLALPTLLFSFPSTVSTTLRCVDIDERCWNASVGIVAAPFVAHPSMASNQALCTHKALRLRTRDILDDERRGTGITKWVFELTNYFPNMIHQQMVSSYMIVARRRTLPTTASVPV